MMLRSTEIEFMPAFALQDASTAVQWLPLALHHNLEALRNQCETVMLHNIQSTAELLQDEGSAGRILKLLVSKLLGSRVMKRHAHECKECKEDPGYSCLQCAVDDTWTLRYTKRRRGGDADDSV